MSDAPTDLNALFASAAGELEREIAAAQAEGCDPARSGAGATLTVCVAGAVGSARPALLAALRGGDPIQPPLPEEPSEIFFWSPPDRPEIRFALPPAFQDVRPELRAAAERFLRDEADVLLFVLNANAGVSRLDAAALDSFRAAGKPFLVILAKIETLRPADRGIVLQDAEQKLGLAGQPPLGVSAASGLGLPELRARLWTLLDTRGKGILLDRLRVRREDAAEQIVADAFAAVSGARALALSDTASTCIKAGARLACLAGQETRLASFRDALRDAFDSPRTRELAGLLDEKGAAAGSEPRALLEALAYATLHTARSLFLAVDEPPRDRLREIFQGRLLEHQLRRSLGPPGTLDPGRTAGLLSEALRTGQISPARLARILPGVKDLYRDWRAGALTENDYVARVGALLRGETPPAAIVPAHAAAPAAAAPQGNVIGRFAGQVLGDVTGDLVDSLWKNRLRPNLERWTEEQKAVLAVDLLRIRAELEVDIDRKHADLLKRTRQEAEDFMKRAVAMIDEEARKAEERARSRLWFSSLMILGWAVLGLIYALCRRFLLS